MAGLIIDPRLAGDYDDRTAAAVKAVLIEIGQILGSFHGKFAVVGGGVPWLLLDNEDMRHVGTLDVDLTLHAEALGDGEYATLVGALMKAGYEQGKDPQTHYLSQITPHGPINYKDKSDTRDYRRRGGACSRMTRCG
jgi:hypothetical protein